MVNVGSRRNQSFAGVATVGLGKLPRLGKRPRSVQYLRARAIKAHRVVHPGMIGRQLAALLSQPPNWMVTEPSPSFFAVMLFSE